MSGTGDAGMPGGTRGRRYAEAASEGVALGLFAAYFAGAGTAVLPYVATAFAAGAGSVAVRLFLDARRDAAEASSTEVPPLLPRATRPVPAAVDAPRAALEAKVEARREADRTAEDAFRRGMVVADGKVSQRRGAGWAVFDAPDAAPRVMSDREYARLRRTTRDLVEIEPTWEGTRVSRLYLGRLDSSLSGRPSVEVYDADHALLSSDWHVEGRAASEEEVLEAHAALAGAMPAP